MLGFNPLGVVAIGQISGDVVLSATFGSFALTGNDIIFKVTLPAGAGAFVMTGISVTLTPSDTSDANRKPLHSNVNTWKGTL